MIESCSITTVLKRALSWEQNTRRDDKESNIVHGIAGNDQFFHGKSESNTPWWAPFNAGSILMVLKMHSDPYKVAYNAGFKAGKIRADKVTQMIFFNSFMSDNFV